MGFPGRREGATAKQGGNARRGRRRVEGEGEAGEEKGVGPQC